MSRGFVVSAGISAGPCERSLFGGMAAGSDSGACRSEKGSCGADHSEDSGWIFGRVCAATLRVQREDDGEKKSEAEKHQGGFLHCVSICGGTGTKLSLRTVLAVAITTVVVFTSGRSYMYLTSTR